MKKSWRIKLQSSEFKLMRLQDASLLDTPTLDQPAQVAQYLRTNLVNSPRYSGDVESFVVVHLNTRRKPIGFEVVSNGTLDTLMVHAREVFRSAIVMNASAIILAHNHPSGDPTPSEADIKVTRDLIKAGMLLKLEVLDHIILGDDNKHSSMRELGHFYT